MNTFTITGPCPGCPNPATHAYLSCGHRLCAERDDMMELYRQEHEKHTATLAQMDALRADLLACVDALRCIRYASPSWSIDFTVCDKVLARPGIVGLTND